MEGAAFAALPVFVALGIGLYFTPLQEPGLRAYGLAGLALLTGLALRFVLPRFWPATAFWARPGAFLAAAALGFLAAGLRAERQEAPMLDRPYYGAFEGRVVEIDRSQSDALRLTLDQVALEDLPPAETPLRIRISLHSKTPPRAFSPGERVMGTAFLAAPEGPVEPGAFDFRRMAYFERLGAVGYTQSPVLLWQKESDYSLWINRLRSRWAEGMRAAIPGDPGAFAAGAMTGDRSGLSKKAVDDLRDSSLAHLLAISGMNMAFLAAFVFALIRGGLALIPPLALRINTKKLAAFIAFFIALFYLVLSGANVATTRAFLMIAFVLGAVLLGRRALSFRPLALAALILLLWQPESLLAPGFQMSFAATVALIAGFRAFDAWASPQDWPLGFKPLATLILSSFLGGLATAPFAAAHFNRFADYGFLANLLTVPVMGAIVMPAGVLAALAAPFGLEALPLWAMGKGSAWILYVAEEVAAQKGAVTAIKAPGPWVLPLWALAGLWAALVAGRAKALAFLPILAALALWQAAPRPALLIESEGRILGLLGPEGRALSAEKGAGFAARSWLENDGDLAAQAEAAARPGFSGPPMARRFRLGPWEGVALRGKDAVLALPEACTGAGLVVLAGERPVDFTPKPESCRLIDAELLAKTGPLALDLGPGGALLWRPTHAGSRRWSRPGAPAAVQILPPP